MLKIRVSHFTKSLFLNKNNETNNLNKLTMGFFWDLMQQNEIQEQGEKAKNLEEKVAILEKKLEKTNETLQKTLIALENYLRKDIDGDGKMGSL